MIRCEAIAIPSDTATAMSSASAGRWEVYSGDVVLQVFDGQAVDIIVDLATCSMSRPVVPCLVDHDTDRVVGRWSDPVIEASRITAGLEFYVDNNPDNEANTLAHQVALDHPWEASIGEDPRHDSNYERIEPGTTLTLNERTIEVGTERPFFVARNVSLYEISVVTFGADAHTGRIAAALQAALSNPDKEEQPMSIKDRKAALTAKHPTTRHPLICSMLIDGADDDAIEAAIVAEDISDKDDMIASLQEELATITAERDEMAERIAAMDEGDEEEETVEAEEEEEAPAIAASNVATGNHIAATSTSSNDSTGATPASWIEARRLTASETGKKGMALQAETRRRFPDLAPNA